VKIINKIGKINKLKTDVTSILSLFTSFSILLCCALPALLVILGLGAVMAGLVSDLPFLRTLNLYKEWTFSVTTLLIIFNIWLIFIKKTS
jgi:hypothetical protein